MPGAEQYPDELLYNKDHDWVRLDGTNATFGITWYAQEQLGEIVFWDGAKVGDEVAQGNSYTELESVKAVSEVVAPLSGRIVAVNEAAIEDPGSINESPYVEGWLIQVAVSSPEEATGLLDSAAYQELLR